MKLFLGSTHKVSPGAISPCLQQLTQVSIILAAALLVAAGGLSIPTSLCCANSAHLHLAPKVQALDDKHRLLQCFLGESPNLDLSEGCYSTSYSWDWVCF